MLLRCTPVDVGQDMQGLEMEPHNAFASATVEPAAKRVLGFNADPDALYGASEVRTPTSSRAAMSALATNTSFVFSLSLSLLFLFVC